MAVLYRSDELLGKYRGYLAQDALWQYYAAEAIRPRTPGPAETSRMRGLIVRYADTPIDLADASIVAAAKTLGLRGIFTLDSDYLVYRPGDTGAFEVAP
jgi:uncharacterized protein